MGVVESKALRFTAEEKNRMRKELAGRTGETESEDEGDGELVDDVHSGSRLNKYYCSYLFCVILCKRIGKKTRNVTYIGLVERPTSAL